ncbi:MAG: hypothetical protein K9M56_04100 [Victivallales bacterium]|nr:hypothetical protein [Victivallales bacterium]
MQIVTFKSAFGNNVEIPAGKCYKFKDKISSSEVKYYIEYFNIDSPTYKKELSEDEYHNLICRNV